MVKVIESNKLTKLIRSKEDVAVSKSDHVVFGDGSNQFIDFEKGVKLGEEAAKRQCNIYYGVMYDSCFYIIAKDENEAINIVNNW